MEVAIRQPSVQGLARSLHEFLQETLTVEATKVALQVQCLMKQGTLMVLVQHPADTATPAAKEWFEQLELALLRYAPNFVSPVLDLDLPYCNQIRLYLRVFGQQQPYAQHRFVYQNASVSQSAEVGAIASDQDLGTDSDSTDFSFNPFAASNLSPETLDESTFDETSANSALVAIPAEDAEVPDSDEPMPVSSSPRRWLWGGAAIAVSLVSFGAGMVLMTYPCVLGRCEPIQKAQFMSSQSGRSLQQAKSNEELLRVRQQLIETNRLLTNVPPWSNRYTQAQNLLQTTQSQKLQVERVLAAEGKTGAALQRGQTTPQTAASWQAVKLLWQDAIHQLSTIPADSPVYHLAQNRLTSYRENLAGINRLLGEEQAAQRQLQAGKSAAQKAEARQGIAQSLESWQLVQASWQVAVNNLQQVPNTTTAFASAQELLGRYNPKLAVVRDRVTREQTAQKSYTQATQLAKTAQTYEQQNQWSMAVITWRKALNQARQVPKETPLFEPAQALEPSYTQALTAAETQLRSAIVLQKAQNDLERVCSGTPQICSFLITKAVIRVQFTPTYEQTMRSAFAAGQTGNSSVVGNAINHIDGLRLALQAIANNSGTPVESYSADSREIVWGFNPGG
jgi:anion-transporting  ArsA/GET3 family ATPase